ncbi:MAG: hypothetical protein GY811_29070 [Myxococcales bacterium]|nr:hypothetical protein [Myxococcales bacterium]
MADREGAEVQLDGKVVGVTPLAKPIDGLTLGPH